MEDGINPDDKAIVPEIKGNNATNTQKIKTAQVYAIDTARMVAIIFIIKNIG